MFVSISGQVAMCSRYFSCVPGPGDFQLSPSAFSGCDKHGPAALNTMGSRWDHDGIMTDMTDLQGIAWGTHGTRVLSMTSSHQQFFSILFGSCSFLSIFTFFTFKSSSDWQGCSPTINCSLQHFQDLTTLTTSKSDDT